MIEADPELAASVVDQTHAGTFPAPAYCQNFMNAEILFVFPVTNLL
jgi:hypothetical protein